MRLSYLLKDILPIPFAIDCEISAITLDSRHIAANSLFFAVKGSQWDGREYIDAAIAQGAVAVLMEANVSFEPIFLRQSRPVVPIYQLKNKLGHLAAAFYDCPAKKVHMIGVTGTSGKTSCSHFIAQALHAERVPCGVIGTLGNGPYGALGTPSLTTPDAVTLQSILHQLITQRLQAIVMEVSSHSIDQERIAGIDFDVGIFTNLTQDHLDYHGDMNAYAACKRRFFAEYPTKQIIMNADDAYGQKWIAELAEHKSVVAYGLKQPHSLPANIAHVYADNIKATLKGISAQVYSPWGNDTLAIPLIGQFNLSNSLAALAALCLMGVPFRNSLQQLSQLHVVPGRMQTLSDAGKRWVVVDYAHKPDALQKVLMALRQLTEGKLICVFGCGGERDRSKRPLMASIAERWADQVIVTNDNPRHEKPEEIIAEIMQGFAHPERVIVELDRSKAIDISIQCAKVKDCVLIAGKGAERYQQIGDKKEPFDDVEKARAFLRRSN